MTDGDARRVQVVARDAMCRREGRVFGRSIAVDEAQFRIPCEKLLGVCG